MPSEATELREPSGKRTEPSAETETELAVSGMSCGNCARHVTEAIQSVAGVRSALVSLDAQSARIRWEPGAARDLPPIFDAIEKAGFKARLRPARDDDHAEHKLAGWQWTLWIGLLGTAPLMLGEWVFQLGTSRWFQWFSFGVASLVQTFAGAPFYRGAWAQIKIRGANMDTLVALGSTTAFGYSVWALLSGIGGHLYFMESASIISLISLGHWVESRVGARASSALRQLLNLAPAMAQRSNPDGTEETVPASTLRVGEMVVLKPGDRVPTDGEVIDGTSAVDEAMLTGEAAPVDKSPSSPLFAGTLNLNGRLRMRITSTGEETALAQIISAVQRAQTSRANIQRLGDRISGFFVPLVVTAAIAAGLWWACAPDSARQVHVWFAQFLPGSAPPSGSVAAGFIIATAVLIIACPCAMGLATPAAIMAGTNAAAQRGILIRDGVALEKAGHISTVLFDKTGTLTFGNPSANQLWEHRSIAGNASKLAASLARHSNHPISQSIARLSQEYMTVMNWRETPGGGVEAQSTVASEGSALLRLGSLRWLEAKGVDISAAAPGSHETSLVGLASGNTLVALFGLQDNLKPHSRSVIESLQKEGLKVYLVTGDHLQVAQTLAERVGISHDRVFAEVRPEQKSDIVKRLQQQGERVAFVGDGINDAPALEQADLGIAVSRASDVAREAADIILLNSEIQSVPESLGLARATLRTIKQNLFWAFFYNSMGVPLAALGFMSPILCAAAMGLSDLVVIGNALRLRRWRVN